MLSALNNFILALRDAFRRTVKSVIKARYFPEVWYLTESWLQTIKGRRILILGYSLGMLGEVLAKVGWRVTLVDPSVTALTDLRKRFARAELEGDFQQCALEKTPFPDGSFDAVVCINVLEFVKDPRELIVEMGRLLAPGGHAIVATFNRFSFWGFSEIARLTQKSERYHTARFLDKSTFARLFSKNTFILDNIVPRAAYLPVGGFLSRFKIPIPGAFVALLKRKSS